MGTTSTHHHAPSYTRPLYSSAAGEWALRAHYAAALAALPFPHQERLVHTESFGEVHVVICGHRSAPPLMVWHGAGAPAPFALASLAPLVARFRVYAPDLPLQAGSRSHPAVLDPATHGYGRWCAEVLEGLGLMGRSSRALPPLHVGICLGGAALLDLAAIWPEAISGAALIVPLCMHPDSSSRWLLAGVVLQLLLPALLYRLLPCHWTAWLALRCLCDEPLNEDPGVQCIRLALWHVAHFPPPPRPFNDKQLQRLRAPTLVLTAEHDLLGAGPAAAERARRVIPHCEAFILRGARHIISAHWMREAVRRTATFFHERGLMPVLTPPPRQQTAAARRAAAATAAQKQAQAQAGGQSALPASAAAAATVSTAVLSASAAAAPAAPAAAQAVTAAAVAAATAATVPGIPAAGAIAAPLGSLKSSSLSSLPAIKLTRSA